MTHKRVIGSVTPYIYISLQLTVTPLDAVMLGI